MEKIYDMLVVGGGPAGYTAALYAARSGFTAAVLEKMTPGGQMVLTHQIDNYPGFELGIDGYSLAEQMRRGAERFGVETVLTQVESAQLSGKVKTVTTDRGTFRGRTVVIATGASPRRLGLPAEEEMIGRGVSYCAACDGMFFRNKTVVVVGGGNSAVGDALILSRIAKEVILVHRRNTLRATRIYHEQLQKTENITLCMESAVEQLLGQEMVSGVVIRDLATGESREVPCQGLFISVGRAPETGLFAGQLELDEGGYIRADETTRTAIDGVYAAGDVRTKLLRQVVTATADGACAAHAAEEYLAHQD